MSGLYISQIDVVLLAIATVLFVFATIVIHYLFIRGKSK